MRIRTGTLCWVTLVLFALLLASECYGQQCANGSCARATGSNVKSVVVKVTTPATKAVAVARRPAKRLFSGRLLRRHR